MKGAHTHPHRRRAVRSRALRHGLALPDHDAAPAYVGPHQFLCLADGQSPLQHLAQDVTHIRDSSQVIAVGWNGGADSSMYQTLILSRCQ
jgi:hypothetical protein